MSRPDSYSEQIISAQDGLQLYYRDYGPRSSSLPPLLCLPGLVRNSADFHKMALRFCDERRVICPDLRGRGKSAWDEDGANYHPRTYLSDIHHVMTAAGIHRVIVIGTSLGGLLTMGMGAVMPTAIAGVVLNDIGPEVSPEGLARINGYVGKEAAPATYADAAQRLKRDYARAYPDYSEADWLEEAHRNYHQDADGKLVLPYDPKIGGSTGDGEEVDLWALFGSLKNRPLLLIHGLLSDILSRETVKKMQAVHPGMELLELSNRGHTANLDEPPCLEVMDRFIKTIP